MNEPTLETVLQRLGRLEQQVRWWKGVGLFAMALLGLVLLMGAIKGKDAGAAQEIRARRFVVVDGNNRPRLVLGKSKYDDSELVLIAEDGGIRAELSLLPGYGSPALALYDKGSRRRAYLAINDSFTTDSAELQLIGKEGLRIDLRTWSEMNNGAAYVRFSNNQVDGSLGVQSGSVKLQFAQPNSC